MSKLLELAKTKIGCGYVWGSQGEMITAEKLEWFKKTFGAKHYDFTDGKGAVSASKWIGKQSFDCSGLVVWCLWQLGWIRNGEDHGASDLFYSLCTPVKKEELQPGDLLFEKGTTGITHVGIYAGGNNVVHAMGTRWGVVYGNYLDNFNLYGRLKVVPTEVPEKPIGKPIKTGVVNANDGLNVRSGPGVAYAKVDVIAKDSAVSIFEIDNTGWYRIGSKRWVSAQYVTINEKKDPVDLLVERMIKDKIVTSEEEWEAVLRGEKTVNLEWLKVAFTNACNEIEKK